MPGSSQARKMDMRLWQEQCDAARRIRDHFGTAKALTYLVGGKFLGLLRDLERDHRLAPDVEDFAAEIRTIFTPADLREYLRRARSRKHPGKPTDDLRYAPDEALFIAQMKHLLLSQEKSRSRV